MVNRARSLLSLVCILLGGCATPPPPPLAPITPARLPFPAYVAARPPTALGGASWRGGRTEHALDPDGQWCGITLEGRTRCWPRAADPSAKTPPETGAPKARPAPDTPQAVVGEPPAVATTSGSR